MSDAAAADGPRTFAAGTLKWGDGPDQHVDWDLEQIVGFTQAVSLNTTSDTRVASRSASRQGPDDQLWFVATEVGDGAPPVVFGGAAADVEAVVLVDTHGDQVKLTLVPVPDEGWNVAIQQLPVAWGAAPSPLDVVALAKGAEIAREPLTGLS